MSETRDQDEAHVRVCAECGNSRGHKMSCQSGNAQAAEDQGKLDRLWRARALEAEAYVMDLAARLTAAEQARDEFLVILNDVDGALDGQFGAVGAPKRTVAHAVQEQRFALEAAEARLRAVEQIVGIGIANVSHVGEYKRGYREALEVVQHALDGSPT